MKKRVNEISIINILFIFIFFTFPIFAGAPRIVSVTMVPSQPSYGDLVNIYVTACVNKYTNALIDIAFSRHTSRQSVGTAGQVFVVSIAGVDNARVNPNVGSDDIGYTFAASDSGATNDCTDCGGDTNSRTITRHYLVHVPDSTFFTSCGEAGTLYLHVGMKDSYLGKGDWPGLSSCQSYSSPGWLQPVPTQNFTITKSVEGTLQSGTSDLLLYKIDYTYQNGNGFRIVEDIPAGFTIVSYGPQQIPGGSVNPGTSSITWNFPDMSGQPGMKQGTVWVLVQWNGSGSGPFTNTATGSWAGSNPQTSSVQTRVGDAAFTIQKSQSADSLLTGSQITYYLSYSVNGYQLRNFQAFDNASGVYSGGSAPPGWRSLPEGGQHGTWTVEDPCNIGDRYITGSSTQYPALLLDDGSSSNNSDQFCDGMILTDVLINAGTLFPGADALVIIRNNGLQGSDARSLGIVVSIDNQPGVGYFMIQKCSGTSCNWNLAGGMPAMGAPVAGVWYKVRVLVTNETNGQRIQAKIWIRGEAEPANWDINYLDTTLYNTDWDCRGTVGAMYNDWRPGVGEQSGDYDDTKDSYDNFVVYKARNVDNGFVIDDIPTSVTYVGCNGCANTGSGLSWSLPSTGFQSGSFTWWGVVSGCSQISNRARINGGSDVFSNWVFADVLCWSPTYTPTRTFTATPTPATPTFTSTRTFTSTITFTPTYTRTPTTSPTYTPTPSITSTPSRTSTPTFTNTPTPSFTPSPTPSFTPTPTPSRTPTPTNTNTPSPTPSPTPSFTPTPTPSRTPTPTNTNTPSSTPTPTPSLTPTPTPSRTPTPTNTVTISPSPTYTFTNTSTPTPTRTATPTFTNTPSPTPSYTMTRTSTPTFTLTDTVSSNTPTATPTFTVTSTRTPTPTNTFTSSPTPTWTATSTRTATPTFTNTPSPTPSYTMTRTSTPTFTLTDTVSSNTPTATPTFTVTSTRTPTPTNTNTPSPSYTSTPTPTRTPTPTYTVTVSPSPTYTFTNTLTPTPTYTYTLTRTPTFTYTDTISSNTPTVTPTYTSTNTVTLTRTFTSTYTNTTSPTPTWTVTNTPTYTLTRTYTPTLTDTRTATPTYTWTDTVSSNTPTITRTFTSTWTVTSTYTNTQTQTSTRTNTSTYTVTTTPTDTRTPTATYTETYPNTPTNTRTITPTYTDTRTATDTRTETPTFTETITWTMTRTATDTRTQTYTWTETMTSTQTPSFTETRTLTLTRTSTVTWTYTNTRTATPTSTDTRTQTVTPTFTVTWTDTPLPTASPTLTETPTMVLYPYVITLSVYNEAGEKVKVIASTAADAPASSLEFFIEGTTTTTTVISYGSGLDIYLRNVETEQTAGMGYTVFTWKAINEQSQLIDQGVYYIKVESIDPYGHTSTFIKDITVVRIEEYVELNIYNNAGEIVRTIREKKEGLTPAIKLELPGETIYLEKGQNNILIQYGTGVGENIIWDGKNHRGELVTNGIYEIQVILKTEQGTVMEASKTVVILREDKLFFDTVKAYPNPITLDKGEGTYMTIEWTLDGVETGEILVKIYNVAGELVRHMRSDLEAGSIKWDMKTDGGKEVARGIYICVVEGRNDEGYKDKRILKLGVLGQELEY